MTELANLMGVTEADLAGFIACLKVWTDKGYTLDQAIAKHQAQMTRLANNAASVAAGCKDEVAGTVWDAVNA